jgi:hypothetical protein
VIGCASLRLSLNVVNLNEKCAVRKEWFESHWSTGHQESVAVYPTCMTDFFGQEYLKLETISLIKSEKSLLILPDFNCSFYKGVNKQLMMFP